MSIRMVGSPGAVRNAEDEKNQRLQQLRNEMKASNAEQSKELGVQSTMNRLREERALQAARGAAEDTQSHLDADHRVKGMDQKQLQDYEAEQYTEMANLDAELRDLAAKENELKLGERIAHATQRAVEAGVSRPPAIATSSDSADMSRRHRQERLERLVADRSARQEVIKRQKEHLLAERNNIETEMRGLQAQQVAGGSHADSMNKIMMTRQDGGGQTFKAIDNTEMKAPANASGNTQMMVNQLASRYHEDRRKLQILREQQAQLQKEIESTTFSNWKPSARDQDAAASEPNLEEAIHARAEFAREVNFEKTKRDLSSFTDSLQEQDAGIAAPSRHKVDPEILPAKDLKTAAPSALPAAKLVPTGNQLQDEIQSLKYDYLSRGGKDSSLLEAIAALERQAHQPTARAMGGMRAGMPGAAFEAGARAVQGVYSNQWPGASADLFAMHDLGGAPASNMHSGYGLPANFDAHKARSMQEEMARMDAAIALRQQDAKDLEKQLQLVDFPKRDVPVRNRGEDSSARLTGSARGEVHGRQLTEEEEELMDMEAHPKDTELYRLRKQHLKNMIALKYDMQRLQQETAKDELEQQVEMMKKEHERREWVLKQQQQLLEAKYRKHMAREKPFSQVEGGQTEGKKPKDISEYSPDVGLNLYVDYVLGLPSKVNNQVQFVYGFYEGLSAKTETKSLPMSGVEHDGSSLRAVVAVKRSFLKVAANDKLKVLLELQSVIPATADRGPRTMPVGWTMLRLFNHDGDFNRGMWRVPLFLPPVRPDFAPEDLVNVHRIKDLEVFLRLVPGQQSQVHDRFSVNPDMTQMQYKYPTELQIKQPEKRVPVPESLPQASLPPVPPLPLPGQAGAEALPGAMQEGSVPLMPSIVHPSLMAPTAALQLHLHDLSGSIFGHGHCREPGPVFVRASLAALSSGHLIRTSIGAHSSVTVPSPGLRVLENVAEEGEEPMEEWVFKEAHGSWCTSSVSGGDESLVSIGQGCVFEHVPCSLDTVLLLEVYREHVETAESQTDVPTQGNVSQPVLRQNPDGSDTLISWASIPLFARAGAQEPTPEGEERSEWSKAGLRVLTSVQERALLAPPISYGRDYDTLRLEQSKYADVLSCEGLATSTGGMTVILNAPLPTLRVTIEVPQVPVLDKFGRVKDAIGAAQYLQKAAKTSRLAAQADTIFRYEDKEAWKLTPDAPISNELFAADDGFDIYIDAARWMPDNVALTTVTCFVASSKMQLYGKFEKEIDARTMNVRCPLFLARKEMRRDPSRDWDPTLTLLIQINGLECNPTEILKKRDADRSDKVADGQAPGEMAMAQSSATHKLPCVIVGFSVLHLFVDTVSGIQPASNEVREFALNEGSFQLPMHRSGLKEKEDLSAGALDDELRRLCSTVLVRIVKAPRLADGTRTMSVKDHPGVDEAELAEHQLLVRPKPYHEAGYSSSMSRPNAMEEVLYPQRLSAARSKMISAAELAMALSKRKLSLEEEDALRECEAFLPEHFNDTLKTMRAHIKNAFKDNLPTRVLDTKFSAPYMPDQGFLLSVDGIDNVSQDYFAIWTGAFSSTLPQAQYYQTQGQVSSDVTLFYQMDFQADASSPRWTDGWMWYQRRDLGVKGRLVAIIDVRMVVTEAKVSRKMKKLKSRQIVQLGFGFLPIIGPAGSYVLSGNHRLPLYAMGAKPQPLQLDQADQLKPSQEGPSSNLLERIEVLDSSLHIQHALGEAVKDKEIHLVEGASVLCRLVDRSRYGEFVRPFMVEAGPNKIDTSCLPEGSHGTYAVRPAKMSLQKKLKDTVGSFSAHNNMMLDFFKSSLKLGQSIMERPKSPRESLQSLEEEPAGLPEAALDTAARSPLRGAPAASRPTARPTPSRPPSQNAVAYASISRQVSARPVAPQAPNP